MSLLSIRVSWPIGSWNTWSSDISSLGPCHLQALHFVQIQLLGFHFNSDVARLKRLVQSELPWNKAREGMILFINIHHECSMIFAYKWLQKHCLKDFDKIFFFRL